MCHCRLRHKAISWRNDNCSWENCGVTKTRVLQRPPFVSFKWDGMRKFCLLNTSLPSFFFFEVTVKSLQISRLVDFQYIFCHFPWWMPKEIKLLRRLTLKWSIDSTEAKYYKSSHLEIFSKRVVFKNFTKFTGKDLCRSLFFNKVAGLRPAILLKKDSDRFFLVNFVKLLVQIWKSLHIFKFIER